MAKFAILVEFHDATRADYTALHEAMEAKVFSRRFKSVRHFVSRPDSWQM